MSGISSICVFLIGFLVFYIMWKFRTQMFPAIYLHTNFTNFKNVKRIIEPKKLIVTSESHQGKRPHMEDTYAHKETDQYLLSAVFDGHGGPRCSAFLKQVFPSTFDSYYKTNGGQIKKALMDTCNKLQSCILNETTIADGSTANVVVVDKNSKTLHVLNLGDSRAVVAHEDQIFQTVDHKPVNDRLKICKNGFVENGRVNGILAVSRSFGDAYLSHVMPFEPEIFEIPMQANFEFVIHCTDGVFDVWSSQAICQLFRKFCKSMNPKECVKNAFQMLMKNINYEDNATMSLIIYK